MIYFSDNKFSFYTNKVNFTSSQDGKQSAYCNYVQDYLDMVKNYPWQFSNLTHETVVPTIEQQARLDLLNNLEADYKNNYESECVLFVEHGVILPESKSSFLLAIQQDYSATTVAYVETQRVQAAKTLRQAVVNAIVITTASGKAFDGDEQSQDRMSRAINALNALETTLWVLSDNTPTMVSREELQEALRLAGAAQTAIWVKPYETQAT